MTLVVLTDRNDLEEDALPASRDGSATVGVYPTRDLSIAVDVLESIAYRRRPVPSTREGEGGPAQPL